MQKEKQQCSQYDLNLLSILEKFTKSGKYQLQQKEGNLNKIEYVESHEINSLRYVGVDQFIRLCEEIMNIKIPSSLISDVTAKFYVEDVGQFIPCLKKAICTNFLDGKMFEELKVYCIENGATELNNPPLTGLSQLAPITTTALLDNTHNSLQQQNPLMNSNNNYSTKYNTPVLRRKARKPYSNTKVSRPHPKNHLSSSAEPQLEFQQKTTNQYQGERTPKNTKNILEMKDFDLYKKILDDEEYLAKELNKHKTTSSFTSPNSTIPDSDNSHPVSQSFSRIKSSNSNNSHSIKNHERQQEDEQMNEAIEGGEPLLNPQSHPFNYTPEMYHDSLHSPYSEDNIHSGHHSVGTIPSSSSINSINRDDGCDRMLLQEDFYDPTLEYHHHQLNNVPTTTNHSEIFSVNAQDHIPLYSVENFSLSSPEIISHPSPHHSHHHYLDPPHILNNGSTATLNSYSSNHSAGSRNSSGGAGGSGKPRGKQMNISTEELAQRQFPCNFPGCKRAFKRFEHLKRHVKMHTGEKPYACKYPGCNKSFSRTDNLNAHHKTHIGSATRLHRQPFHSSPNNSHNNNHNSGGRIPPTGTFNSRPPFDRPGSEPSNMRSPSLMGNTSNSNNMSGGQASSSNSVATTNTTASTLKGFKDLRDEGKQKY